jgi:putative membrane-bound dehydrogenase-like protein
MGICAKTSLAMSKLPLTVLFAMTTLMAEEVPPPLTPEAALKAFRTKPELVVELVAAEPLVESPVAIDWDLKGRLWVVEMFDYPMGVHGNWKPGGRVKVLQDYDHDGRYDRATVYVDGLPFPTGLLVVTNGVYICAAPDILFAQDTDGDGKADHVRTNYTGFATHNYQARVNGLSWGLDGWIYGSSGLFGGKIKNLVTGGEVDLSGRDFRFHPTTGVIEPAAGISQMGRVRDDEGNWFGNDNSTLLWHYPLPEHYARRNPHVTYPEPRVSVARGKDPNKLFPASRTLERFNDPQMANRVTGACGPEIYCATLLGTNYYRNAFICEPVHNLVTRLVLRPSGVTFIGERAPDETDREFLASTDNWFRPVQVRTGPDGALWVVDMYRFVIEHPRWISAERLKSLDVRAGADKGRIYRIRPKQLPATLAAKPSRPSSAEREQFQRALELGEIPSKQAGEKLARLAGSATDKWVQAAILSSASNHLEQLLAAQPSGLMQGLIQSAVGFGRAKSLANIQLDAQLAAILLDALERKRLDWRESCPSKLVSQMEALLADKSSLALLARDQRTLSQDIRLLVDALPEKAAFARLRQVKSPEVAPAIILKWPRFAPSARAKLIALLLERESWTAELAKGIEEGKVAPAEVPMDQRQRLPKIFAQMTNRAAALQKYRGVGSLRPQPEHGAELFEKNCATCHAHHGRGFAVGPTLAEFAGKSADDFVLAIIDPNAALDPKFLAYEIETQDGRSLSGIVKDETASGLTVIQSGGIKETVLRSAIKEIRASRLSLMPEGLEQSLSPQDMADLIGWIKQPN